MRSRTSISGPSSKSLRPGAAGAVVVTAVAGAIFWRTSYPTITWWDSAQYSLAAATLGIAGSPGSLLLTLLGWPIAHLPVGTSPGHLLNLLAGVLAALTAALVYIITVRLLSFTKQTKAHLGAALGALTFAFGTTLWEYAVQFTPYVLTAVFAALILWVMLRWWEGADQPGAWRWLLLLGFLFGLDFSVHRTNALLMPGALAWVLVRRPRTLVSLKSTLGSAVGLLGGLGVQLLIIPVGIGALTRSPLFWGAPTNWTSFWDYVSLERVGGGFLIQFLPRKADFFSVQVSDFLHVIDANFFNWTGPTSVLGLLPGVAALLGLVAIWRRDRRLAVGYVLVLITQAVMTVLYFNIPENFFRTFDRHYLPVCVSIAPLLAYGLAVATSAAADLHLRRIWVPAAAAGTLVILGPVSQLVNNWSLGDASHRYFTKDFATNLLGSLPPEAMLFVVGDNDTFPLLYFQAVEGMRPDVTIINSSVANLPDFADELARRDPAVPLALSSAERAALSEPGATPKQVTIPVEGTPEVLGIPTGVKPPTAVTVTVKPMYGTKMWPADVTLFDIVRTNRWRRPLCFAITGTRQGMAWLAPYGRLEGLYYRAVPMVDSSANVELLRTNLLEHASYRGFADPAVRLDNEDRMIGANSYVALSGLLEAERKSGDVKACRAHLARFLAALPPDRLDFPRSYTREIISHCGAGKVD